MTQYDEVGGWVERPNVKNQPGVTNFSFWDPPLYTVVIVLDDSRIPKGDSWPDEREEAEEKTC